MGYNRCIRGYGLVVERVLAKDEMGVRFSLTAQKLKDIVNSHLLQNIGISRKSVDNPVEMFIKDMSFNVSRENC